MNRPMDKVCHIYDGFAQEWGRAYPNLAVPSLTSVCNVSLEGDRSCDNSASISDVRCSLKRVNDTIHKLNQELGKQSLIQEFLVQILDVLTGGESAAVSVGEGKVVEKSARQKKDDTGFDPGLVSGQIDSTRVVKGNEEYSTHGLTCDCVSELDESCSLCAVRGKVSSVKDAFDKLSGESFRFVSKIEVSGDRACPRQNQHRPRDHQQNYRNSWITSRHDATGVHPSGNDSSLNSAITRSNSVPDSDMFRKGKQNVASDEPVVRHKVGSKDNFLAVQAKHISPSELAKNFDSVSSSPKMNRHYQMLKLTHGFDVVLDSGTEGGDSNNKKSPAAGDSHNHGSTVMNPRSDNVSGKEAKISNRAESPSLIKASTRGMVSIITVENTKKTPIDTQGNSVVLPDSNALNTPPPLDVIKQGETETSTGEHAINSTGSSLSRQSVKKAPVPPPVAKKPVKLSNSNQLSPSTAGPNPFTRVWDLSPDVHSPSYSLRNSVERKDSHSQSDVNRAVGDVKDSVSETVSSTRDSAESRKSESIKVTPPSPLVADFTSKYVDRQNSWPSELKEERTKGEVTTSDLAENSVAYREAKFVEGLCRPKSEEILAMRSFKPQIADDEQRKTKFGVDGLADNLRTSFGLVRAKFQDCNNLSERNSDSVKLVGKRSSTPPAPPPRLQVEKPEIKSVDGVGPGGHADAVRRMSSSTSTDTVTEFNRNMSLSSDFDVKEALSTLDTLLTSQGADDLDEAPVEKPKRYALKTPLYENWTINRAITSSFNQGDFDSISDDDELEGASISSAADSPSHKRHSSPTGSKDSGLCEETTADSSSYPDSVFDSEISSGRIRNLKVLQALELREEEASDQCDSLEEPPLNFVDYTDVEEADNDFVYSTKINVDQHASNRTPSPCPDYGQENNVHLHEVDRSSWATESSGDEEIATPMDTSHEELDSATEGILKMRQLLVKGVLDSEKEYLEMLNILIHYKHSLEASSQGSMPVISKEDIATIFSNIEDIYDIHNEFVQSLTPKVQKWTHSEAIGDIFKIMITKFIHCDSYLKNYHLAVSTVHRCCSESEQFLFLAKEIKISQTLKQTTTLEDALFKPVQRVQRNILVLHDLIKYTPEDHPDKEALEKTLKLSQHILERFATAIPKHATTKENRRLVKSSFLVELVNGVRKLRFMFLFNDILICTKRVPHRNNKVTFDIKWFTPLNQMTYDTKFGYRDDLKSEMKETIEELKTKLRILKKELKLEMKKHDGKEKNRSSGGAVPRQVEKLRKKINQLEAQLILACPKLPFKVSLEGGKTYTLLMTTDYEREEWKETLASLMTRTEQQVISLNSIFIQELINSVKETPQVNKIGNVLLQPDEDILTGTLNVTIHKLNGLTEDCDTYCCLEMDSFGHFFMKAKTHIRHATRDPAWNEDFELELEGSQTIRFLCFKKEEGDHGDKLLGRGALELSRHWLKSSFQEKTVVMNEISLVISVRHTAADKTMSRTPSRTSSAVFGVKISTCARREGKTVPSLVTACLQEVEKRGLDEVGIYRVSGVTSDLQRIKKLFDRNVRAGIAALEDADIHTVTGTLKLYLRELPEPLFTEANYQNFIDTLKLKDEEARGQCMLNLLHGLPDINYYTIVSLLEHLLKVARNVSSNKMSVHNLATVFGPTLLAPAVKQDTTDPMELMFKGAEEVMHQSSVINYLLGIAISGRSLRKSAQ